MGTDIHGVFQKCVDGSWIDVPSNFESNRHYDLFAHLAGVRNGRGFAGVLMGQAVQPIAEPRGLPSGFEIDDDQYYAVEESAADEWSRNRTYWDEGQTQPKMWMGYHDHSWLTGEEILSHNWGKPSWKAGVVTVEFFNEWDGVDAPQSSSGGIWGRDVNVAENPAMVDSDTTHVRIFWRQSGGEEFKYFTDEVERLVHEHGNVRFVFGFDS